MPVTQSPGFYLTTWGGADTLLRVRKDEPIAADAALTWARENLDTTRKRIFAFDFALTILTRLRLVFERFKPRREFWRDREIPAFDFHDILSSAITQCESQFPC